MGIMPVLPKATPVTTVGGHGAFARSSAMALRAGAKADWACGAGRSGKCGRPFAAGTWSRWDGGRGETGIAEVGGATEKLEGRGSMGVVSLRAIGFSVVGRGGALGAGGRAIAVGATNGQDSRFFI